MFSALATCRLYSDERVSDDKAVPADLGEVHRLDGGGAAHLRALWLEEQLRNGEPVVLRDMFVLKDAGGSLVAQRCPKISSIGLEWQFNSK